MENVLISYVCAFSVPSTHLTVTLMRSLLGLSFVERISGSKCMWARPLAVGSELLHQFSACGPLDRDSSSYFAVLTFTRGECVI